MSHCDHCQSKLHQKLFSVKRFGILGAIIMVAHLLFHIVEFLLLPALVIGAGHATNQTTITVNQKTETRAQLPKILFPPELQPHTP